MQPPYERTIYSIEKAYVEKARPVHGWTYYVIYCDASSTSQEQLAEEWTGFCDKRGVPLHTAAAATFCAVT